MSDHALRLRGTSRCQAAKSAYRQQRRRGYTHC
jgi:hypothetical protein